MQKKILEKNNYKMIKVSENRYEIYEGEDMVMGMEGNFSKEQLEEQFDNCIHGFSII